MATEKPNGTAVAERPAPAAQATANPIVLMLERSKGEIARALPRHLTADRILRMALTTFRRQPELCDCDPRSFVGAVIQASQLGLEFDNTLGHAYLVPFNNKKTGRREAQLIIGYKGFIALARRSGEVATFSAHVVHANDDFDYSYGTEMALRHRPCLADPGPAIAVYAVLKFKDGSHDFEVIGWPKILEMQKQYGNKYGSPWKTDLEEMARKSAIRALAKRAPLSAEFQRAAAVDSAGDGYDGQGLAALMPAPAAGLQSQRPLELGRGRLEVTDREHQVVDPEQHRPSLAPRRMVG